MYSHAYDVISQPNQSKASAIGGMISGLGSLAGSAISYQGAIDAATITANAGTGMPRVSSFASLVD